MGACVVLAGCVYLAPVNRQPKVLPPERVCDAVHPADPCTPDNVHHGDFVMVRAIVNDPDGQASNGTVQWRISACDGSLTGCDVNRLYDMTVPLQPPYPEFRVRSTLTGTDTPVRNIVFELAVFDERGASSTSEDSWNVIADPPVVAPGRSAEAAR